MIPLMHWLLNVEPPLAKSRGFKMDMHMAIRFKSSTAPVAYRTVVSGVEKHDSKKCGLDVRRYFIECKGEAEK